MSSKQSDSTLAEVLAGRERLDSGDQHLRKSIVLEWMESPDIEALGAVYHLIAEKKYTTRIEPALKLAEYSEFLKKYMRRCLLEDPKGDWCSGRYVAGWDLVNWIVAFSEAPKDGPLLLESWKRWLADLYRGGDDELRAALVNATLEHLFEHPSVRAAFADWKEDAVLRGAYDEADEWVQHGGESPLGRRKG